MVLFVRRDELPLSLPVMIFTGELVHHGCRYPVVLKAVAGLGYPEIIFIVVGGLLKASSGDDPHQIAGAAGLGLAKFLCQFAKPILAVREGHETAQSPRSRSIKQCLCARRWRHC